MHVKSAFYVLVKRRVRGRRAGECIFCEKEKLGTMRNNWGYWEKKKKKKGGINSNLFIPFKMLYQWRPNTTFVTNPPFRGPFALLQNTDCFFLYLHNQYYISICQSKDHFILKKYIPDFTMEMYLFLGCFFLHPIIFKDDCFTPFKNDFWIVLSKIFLEYIFQNIFY